MRVLVVTNLWPTPERPAAGGFVRDQVEALRAIEDVEIELFTFPTGSRAYPRAARELRHLHRGGDFDVVHAHYGLAGWVARVLRGAPLVVTFHGTDLAHPVVGPMSRALARLVDLPAPVSASLAHTGLPHFRGRLAVLPCGANLERCRPIERRAAREHLGLDPGGRYLLFPSDPARPEKRFDRARELAAAAGVELLSYDNRPSDDVPLLINAANAVLATSEREGFGLASIEALACDVPVLATDVGVAPLVLKEVDGTLCAPFEREAWLAVLRSHLEHPDPRVAGRARAALWDRNRFARRVLMAYRDLAQRP